MPRKQTVKRCADETAKVSASTVSAELLRLARVLEQIAAMDALPLAPSARQPGRKRRCAI